jgi:hypothetical protein
MPQKNIERLFLLFKSGATLDTHATGRKRQEVYRLVGKRQLYHVSERHSLLSPNRYAQSWLTTAFRHAAIADTADAPILSRTAGRSRRIAGDTATS